mmetsp:Transcript_5891/g.19153  ORF Transcript_5891/g.19153 Transcript_5891/m.19153 type:complete len:233 (+) Transcript_5891:1377-2075(+)
MYVLKYDSTAGRRRRSGLVGLRSPNELIILLLLLSLGLSLSRLIFRFNSAVDLGDDAGADGFAAFSEGEPEAFLYGNFRDQLDVDGGVVSGHDHFDFLREGDDAGDVGGADEELGFVVGEEGRVAAAFLLVQDVDLRGKFRRDGDGARFGHDHAALDFVALRAAEEDADVVAGFAAVEGFLEHLDARADRFDGRIDKAQDFDFVAGLDDPRLDAARDDGPTAGDGERILNRH